MAVIPAEAPATSSVLRSAALRRKHCAINEPKAPPVMMIGPSAPKGPPLPIDIADESGLRRATFSDRRLSPNRMVSMASGIPCPRILSDPNLAMKPTTRLPMIGMAMIINPTEASVIAACSADSRPNQKRLVAIAMSLSRIQAPKAPPEPTASASSANIGIRRSTL